MDGCVRDRCYTRNVESIAAHTSRSSRSVEDEQDHKAVEKFETDKENSPQSQKQRVDLAQAEKKLAVFVHFRLQATTVAPHNVKIRKSVVSLW